MKIMFSVLLLLFSSAFDNATAKPWWARGVESNDADFLDPNVAFRIAARLDGDSIKVRFVIADGYYLYKKRMQIEPESPGLVLGPANFPSGVIKTDPYLGTQEIFTQQVVASVPFSRADAGAHPPEIKVTYQGCAQAGLCYPPISKVIFPAAGRSALAHGALTRPPAAALHPWTVWGILGGALAFLAAGLVLRKNRRLDSLHL